MKKVKIFTESGDKIIINNVKSVETIKKDFDFEKGEGFSVDGACGVFHALSIFGDFKKRVKLGNMFHTKEEAEKAAKEIELYFRLRRFAEIVNEGWKPDWKNEKERKYCCFFFNQEPKGWVVNSVAVWKCINTIYFKTEDLAQRAINEVIIPFEKGELQ